MVLGQAVCLGTGLTTELPSTTPSPASWGPASGAPGEAGGHMVQSHRPTLCVFQFPCSGRLSGGEAGLCLEGHRRATAPSLGQG